MKIFFLVFAVDERFVNTKIEELRLLGVPFLIICGKNLNHLNIIFREPMGKYDAINFGVKFIPRDVDVVVLNDVDTKIFSFRDALEQFILENAALLFVKVTVKRGSQRFFYPILDTIRRRIPINASGELMFLRRDILDRIIPIKPCKAEDSYIFFRTTELKQKVVFCEKCYVLTERTKTAKQDEEYKRKTVCGIYQALSYTRPPFLVKFFYVILPIISPVLLIFGENGYYWMKGILRGLADFLHGDRSGSWNQSYME